MNSISDFYSKIEPTVLSQSDTAITTYLKCPICGINGTFTRASNSHLYGTNQSDRLLLGICLMTCPNPKCKATITAYSNFNHVRQFVNTIFTLPMVKLEINKENIPDSILENLEEAIECHANGLNVSSAIMIRRTLEFICNE